MRLNVVLDCHDPDSLVEFWSVALGYRLADSLDEYRVLVPEPGRDASPAEVHAPVFVLAGVDEVKQVKNRMHLDTHPADPEAQITRLQRLGGTVVGERVERFGHWWQVMADPQGNEFCVVAGAEGPDEGDASSG
ncbi:MAG: VOC family protein [Frankiales bacterium]|nr:VOC family protein [Frankiales bacterium]